MSPLPVWAHELVVAPLVFGLAFAHAWRALGPARAAGELLALALYGYALERVAIAAFASHTYGDAWRLAPGGVPLAVALVWSALIASALALAGRLGFGSPLARAGAAALLGVSLDLLIEPVAVRAGLWLWTPPGPWLSVPFGNFVGWGVIVGVYTLGAEWDGLSESLAIQLLRRLALAAAAVLALVAVGWVWTRFECERAFAGAVGWTAWGALIAATAGLGLRRRPPLEAPTLAGRLGAASARLPSLVFLTLGLVFALDAFALGERALFVAAAGSLGALLLALRDAWPLDLGGRFRRGCFAAMAEVEDLVRVLMKPRNGEAWSEADKAFLRAELRALARLAPAFLLFLLPGSVVLLPLYAWLLDRRRGGAREAKINHRPPTLSLPT